MNTLREERSCKAGDGESQAAARSGALNLLEAMADVGADTCFANPGTTEMPLVKALEQCTRIRPILGLFEGVCTGAADGYARMADRPALTLLHLGPGLANGLANLHNARRALSPIVNIVGDHASWHIPFDAPLTSDIETLAAPMSNWVGTVGTGPGIIDDAQTAMKKAVRKGGGIATLIVPVDFQDEVADRSAGPASDKVFVREREAVDRAVIEAVAAKLRERNPVTLLLGAGALSRRAQKAAQRIAHHVDGRLFAETFPPKIERGGDLPALARLPYFPEQVVAALDGHMVLLAGALPPVAYFAHPTLPSLLVEEDHLIHLAAPSQDAEGALEALADLLEAKAPVVGPIADRKAIDPGQPLAPKLVGEILVSHLPDNAIVSVEGGTCGYPFFDVQGEMSAHTVLTNTGGAIGQGLPVAIGAAVACPDRRVVALQSDGSGQYTVQSLWTMARERLDVVVLIAANRRYAILQNELGRAGVAKLGPVAARLTMLDDPALDWVALARGYGVDAVVVETTGELDRALTAAFGRRGPYLIEMKL